MWKYFVEVAQNGRRLLTRSFSRPQLTASPSFSRSDNYSQGIPTSHPEPAWALGIPTTQLTSKVHHNVNQITKELNEFFLKSWPFSSEKAQRKFVGAEFAYSSCIVWPDATDERMVHAAYLFALLFLVDDHIDTIPLDEGREYNNMVLAFFRGDKEPNRDIPIEWITFDIGSAMRQCDPILFPNVVTSMAQFMAAQTDSRREKDLSLMEYMDWRVNDVGSPLIVSMGLYCNALVFRDDDPILSRLRHIWEHHVIYCNDAWSYDKEVRAAQAVADDLNATIPCSGVTILMRETGLPASAAKRMLIYFAREMEILFKKEVDSLLRETPTPELQKYVKILEYQMSGNEVWSQVTKRYNI
ncbi:isoprenoid synthase domain-containing protein [Flagelloscypha sp. PMI_526]|nr:isoprenoid synthase domain-containing protein [Flagelloscypha sp. PMI_526]